MTLTLTKELLDKGFSIDIINLYDLFDLDENFELKRSSQFLAKIMSATDFKKVVHKEKIIAYISFNVSDDYINLFSIKVLKDFRSKGIGTCLIENLIEEAKKTNKYILLQVEIKNKKALKLYKRLGFAIINKDYSDKFYRMEHDPKKHLRG